MDAPKVIRVMGWTHFIIFIWSCVIAEGAVASIEIFRSLDRAGQWDEAERVLSSYLEKETDATLRTLAFFGLGLIAQKQGKHELALSRLNFVLNGKTELTDFVYILRGKSQKALGQLALAKEEFLKAEALPDKSARAFLEAEFELGEIELSEKRWSAAHSHFNRLEKKLRADEKYPNVLMHLLNIEDRRGRKFNSCKFARKLYSKFPHHALTKNWGIDLQNVSWQPLTEKVSRSLGCVANLSEQRLRIRNLQLQGMSEKARGEIEELRTRAAASTLIHVDSLQASFYLGEGQPLEANQILKPYYEKEHRDFGLLVLLAKVAAQSGEFVKAVNSYERAALLSPRSKAGRSARFQAAFLRYQNQDYEGAAEKFHEFIKKYPKSGLSVDAKWHLAWMKYLKGEHQASLDVLKQIGRSRKSSLSEKVQYWSAMNLLKLGRKVEAYRIFDRLGKDPLRGYYSLAAAARIPILKSEIDVRGTASLDKPDGWEEGLVDKNVTGVDSEESEDENDNSLSETVDDETADGGEDVVATKDSPSLFQNAKMAKRFARANDLIALNLTQWATWELFEIEKRTFQFQHQKALVGKYESIEAFHRSAYVAQVFFGKQRAQQGMSEGKSFWESAYPRAFERSVGSFARAFEVEQELVWSIMRAESQFRSDIKSPVGALGLMQLMPYTAHQVSKLLSIEGFSTVQLFDPSTNIRLGTRYLQRLLKTLDHSIPLTAAAYNAGPHRVKNWLKTFGDKLEMDEFIEHIPFLETRNYVKKVVHNYFVYRSLNGKIAKSEDTLPWIAKPVSLKITGEVESRELWN